MNYADRVQETSTTTGTGFLTLTGASANFQPFSPAIPTGAKVPYGVSDANNWEVGIGTLTAPGTLSRDTVLKGSNGTAPVNFPAGIKTVICTLPAALIAAFQISQDLAFSTAIPLTVPGDQYMPPQASVPAGFTVVANPVKGARVYVRMTGDGTTVPTFTGMKEWGGSLGWDARNGIANQVQFFNDGVDTFYSISQALGAVAIVEAPGQVIGLAAGTPTNSAVPLTWSLPSGGAPSDYLIEYKLTSSGIWLPFADGTSTALAATVTSLAASSAYDFRVSATNSGGTGAVSSTVSATTAAAAPATQNTRAGSLGKLTEIGTGPYSYLAAADAAFAAPADGGITTTGLQSGVDGSFEFTLANWNAGSVTLALLGTNSSATAKLNFNAMPQSMYTDETNGNYKPLSSGNAVTPLNVVAAANGDKCRFRRTGTSLTFEVSKNGGTSYTAVYTWTASTGVTYFQLMPNKAVAYNNLAGVGLA